MTTKETIDKALSLYPKARRIPVVNVSMWPDEPENNRLNLEMDTRLYNWSGDTLRAIRYVLLNLRKL